jgi:hypothetical protein
MEQWHTEERQLRMDCVYDATVGAVVCNTVERHCRNGVCNETRQRRVIQPPAAPLMLSRSLFKSQPSALPYTVEEPEEEEEEEEVQRPAYLVEEPEEEEEYAGLPSMKVALSSAPRGGSRVASRQHQVMQVPVLNASSPNRNRIIPASSIIGPFSASPRQTSRITTFSPRPMIASGPLSPPPSSVPLSSRRLKSLQHDQALLDSGWL